MLTGTGAEVFACAGSELLATGESARKRSDETGDDLTARRRRLRTWPGKGWRTPRSALGSSSARARSSTTSGGSSRSGDRRRRPAGTVLPND